MTDRPPLSASDAPQSGDEQGARAAISSAAPAAEPAEADLFGAELDASLAGQAIRPSLRRGPGRPPGTPNRATTKMRDLLLARGYRDPMEMLAALASMPLGELVKLDIKPTEAIGLQIRAASELMPYWHQAMPKQVQVQSEQVRHLVVINDSPDDKTQPNQRVVDVTPDASHGDTSHGMGQEADILTVFGGDEHD